MIFFRMRFLHFCELFEHLFSFVKSKIIKFTILSYNSSFLFVIFQLEINLNKYKLRYGFQRRIFKTMILIGVDGKKFTV